MDYFNRAEIRDRAPNTVKAAREATTSLGSKKTSRISGCSEYYVMYETDIYHSE